MAELFKIDAKSTLVHRLKDGLGLSDYRVTAIDIKAAAGAFPKATVEFLIPDQYVEAVAKAIEEHRRSQDAEPVPQFNHPKGGSIIAALNRHKHLGRDDWTAMGDAVWSVYTGKTLPWSEAADIAGMLQGQE